MNPAIPNIPSGPTARVPTEAWVVVAALAVGVAAVFVLNVPISTVVTLGLIGLMAFSHLFMHGSHGGHGQHGAQGAQVSQTSESYLNHEGAHSGHIDGPQSQAAADPNAQPKDAHTGHSGGCC